MNIIITGSIGSGKSTFYQYLQDELPDWNFYDCDRMAKELMDLAVYQSIVRSFNILAPRDILKNAAARELLENHVATRLFPELNTILQQQKAVIEASIWQESWRPQPITGTYVVQVIAGEDSTKRAAERDGRSAAEILVPQVSDLARSLTADLMILNTAGEEALQRQALALARALNHEGTPQRALILEKLKARWNQLGIGSDQAFSELMFHYCNPQRHYHGPEHLASMFDQWDALPCRFTSFNQNALELAIWYHDSIWCPDPDRAKLDIHDSAKLLWNHARLGFIQQSPAMMRQPVSLAVELILTTDGHTLSNQRFLPYGVETLEVAKLFLDLDLSSFLATPDHIQKMENLIRSEFSRFNDSSFCSARLSILKRLHTQGIYHSTFFAEWKDRGLLGLDRAINGVTSSKDNHD